MHLPTRKLENHVIENTTCNLQYAPGIAITDLLKTMKSIIFAHKTIPLKIYSHAEKYKINGQYAFSIFELKLKLDRSC